MPLEAIYGITDWSLKFFRIGLGIAHFIKKRHELLNLLNLLNLLQRMLNKMMMMILMMMTTMVEILEWTWKLKNIKTL
jgi:hypothetical protein